MPPLAPPPKPRHPAIKLLRAAKLMSAMHADEFLGMDRVGVQLVYEQTPPAAEGEPPGRRIVFRNILLNPRLIHAWR